MVSLMEKKNYDLTQITRMLLEMRDNCVPKDGDLYDDPKRKEKYEALKAAIDLINNPSQMINMPNWISVKDRLPEEAGKYIVCTRKMAVYCTAFRLFHGKGYFATDTTTHITHWMPMPEPPEQES